MGKKNRNRKKELKKQIADFKRANRKGIAKHVETVSPESPVMIEAVEEKVMTGTESVQSLEDFVSLPELDGVAAARLEVFYEAGIHSLADFAAYSEQDLLALKGIGPATLKQLKEKGISLKG